METTIIKLEPTTGSSNMLVTTTANFEEAFGDYSNANGKGRARRKKRKLERVDNKREVRTERRKLKSDRQGERLERRGVRKSTRQSMRDEQQASRSGRRANIRSERQDVREAKNLRKMTTEEGKQDRDNYALEQENYRESITPRDEAEDTQTNGGYADEQGGGYADEQGGGYADEQGGNYSNEGSASEDWDTPPSGYDDEDTSEEGAYGDDNRYDSPYVQEDSEFQDDSYFNIEGMDGNGVSPMVQQTTTKLRNNERAYKDLNTQRNVMMNRGDNTTGIDIQIKKCYGRMCELRNQLDSYESADGKGRKRRRGKQRRKREMYGGSEVPVDKNLNPDFSPNRIEIPATSNFDAYSDLGRPVIVNGVTQSDNWDYSDDLLNDNPEPTTIDLYSNADGNTSKSGKAFMSIAIGIGVGALALYLAKKKGWI